MLLFLGGMISGFLALLLNHSVEKFTLFWPDEVLPKISFFGESIPLFSSVFWFCVGFNEELAKLIVLLLLVYPTKHITEEYDGILYAVTIAVGFATMENFYYLDQYGIAVVITRTVITIPAHAFMSVPMGYFASKSRLCLENNSSSRLRFCLAVGTLIIGWFLSSFLHGLYDFLLSFNMENIAYLQILFMGALSILISKFALRSTK